MSDNNTMYRMFRQMIQGYKLGKEGENLFSHAVHCWMDLNPDNPFSPESEAFNCFFKMKNYHSVWNHSTCYKVNERRMMQAARDLCATKPKNPYKYDKQEAEREKIALREAAIKQQEEEINIQREAERQKAERDEEIRQILEEIRQDDLEKQNALEENRAIVKQAKKDTISNSVEKYSEKKAVEEKKNYVFNVVKDNHELNDKQIEELREKPKEEKKGFLNKLFRR